MYVSLVFNVSSFWIHLLEDRFVVAGTNYVPPKGEKESLSSTSTYTVKGLLFKTLIPAVYFQMHCSQKMLDLVEMEIKNTTLPCWF